MPSIWPVDGKIGKHDSLNYKFDENKSNLKTERPFSPINQFNRKMSSDSIKKEIKSKEIKTETEKQNEAKNTYHWFRYSCGYKTNRRCLCLNKFVRMPFWYYELKKLFMVSIYKFNEFHNLNRIFLLCVLLLLLVLIILCIVMCVLFGTGILTTNKSFTNNNATTNNNVITSTSLVSCKF